MTTISQPLPTSKPRRAGNGFGLGKSILLALPMLLLSAMLMTQGQIPSDPLQLIAVAITYLGYNGVFFLMLKTGRTDRYRAALFIITALAMIITFSTIIQSTRGSAALNEEDVINGRTPFCHMVIPMVLVPAALTGTIIFPGSLLTGFASIATMIVLWMGSSLVLGRGFCSWMCFYGGYDEGCSRLVKRARIRDINRRWIYFPFALLVVIVLVSAVTLSPTYCEWLCPFKTVTEYAAVTNLLTLIQTIIFLALFIGLVIVLPILTKRRVQCGLFCPFGAMQSLTNKVNIFDVRIDPQKCSTCGRCTRTCPTFSLDESSLKSGHALITCTKCGKCIDACPNQAISYHIKGTPAGTRPILARALFLYPAFILMSTFTSGIVITAIWRLLLFVTTGSML